MGATIRVVLGVFLICTVVWSQGSTSQINGAVRDSSGLAVPGATIKVTQTATGAVRTATSGADGGFIFPNLAIGPYLLEVSKDGFSKYAQSGIVLQVDSNPTIDVALQVGSVSEQVLVQADAALVETHSTGVGQVVDSQRVSELPLNGRDPHELIFLAGMASTAAGVTNLNSVRNYPTVIVSVAGGQGSGVSYLLDGAAHQDPYNSASLPLPFPDALQEFKVETSALPAQYGYHAAAAVNAVTKSGSNEFHGDLFEFLRNGDLNARDFFAATRDSLKRNQFGGVVGGPAKKDKLFFFGGYQRTDQRSDPSGLTGFVPTPAMQAGDFTAYASPACQGGVQKTLNPARGFVNNQISPTLLNSVGLNFAKALPQSTDPCGRVSFGYAAGLDENLSVEKVDWQKSEKNQIFGRFLLAQLKTGSTYNNGNLLSTNQDSVQDLDYTLTVGDTYLFGAGIVSSFRVAANRTNIVKVPDAGAKSWQDLGANMHDQGAHTMSTTVTGAFSVGSGGSTPGQSHNGPNPSFNEDLSVIKGNHQIGFGGGWLHQGMNYNSGLNLVGSVGFDGSVTGLPLADVLYGQASSFSQGLLYGFYTRQNYISLYAQDSWRVTRRLTVNYGVRWEPFTSPYNKFGQINHFDPALFAQNFHSSIFTNAPAGLAFSGEPQYPCGNSYNCPVWDKFLPRIGVVWDPKGDGRMTVRAAYGMYADRNHMFFYNFSSQYAPFGNTIALPNVNIASPWANYPGGDPIPALAAANGIGHADPKATFPLTASQVVEPLNNFHPPYLNQWNLSIQRQVGTDWLLTINYLGNSTIHLATSTLINPAVFLGLGPCTLQTAAGPVSYPTCSTTANQNNRRVLSLLNPSQGQYYGGIGLVDDGGTGTYDALFLSAQKRLSRGVSVLANYTWSHCISDVFDSQTSSGAVQVLPGNRRYYRSNCQYSDLRQVFNLSGVATIPQFSNRVLRLLASNWQISPIMTIKSAQFFTVLAGTDVALTTAGSQTPNLVNTNPYPSNQSINNWINRSAFANAAPGNYGNLGADNLKGPGSFQLNMALSRTFAIREKMALQVRAEAFNLPNHLNPGPPGTGTNNNAFTTPLNASNFGQITTDISGNNGLNNGDYRIVQLAMKFVF
jgi:hypothetical protein